VLALDQAVGNADAKFAGQVIVAGARMPELVVGLGTRLEARRPGQRHRHDALKHLANV
jgi:hypothetical protein